MFGFFKSGDSVAPEEVKENIGKKDVLILDVRTGEEFRDGHIESARNISVDMLESRMKEIEDYRDKTVLVYCHSGMRSSKAAGMLRDKGFRDVRNMKGGLMRWKFDKVR